MQMIMGALNEVDLAAKGPPAAAPASLTAKAEEPCGASTKGAPAADATGPVAPGKASGAAVQAAGSPATEDQSIYDDPPVLLPQCSPEPPRRAARRPPTTVKDNATTRAIDAEVEKARQRRRKQQAPATGTQVPMASLQLFLFALCGMLYSVASRACGSALWSSLPAACEMASYRPMLLLALPTLVVVELLTALVTVVGGAAKSPCTPGAAPPQLPGGMQSNMVVNMLLSSSPTGAAVKESLANAMVMMAYMSHIRFCVSVGVFSLVITYSVLALTGY